MILVGRPKTEIEQRSRLIRAAFRPTSVLRDKLYEQAHGICILCHRPMQRNVPNEIDHLVSVYYWAEQHEGLEEMIRRANEENNLALTHSECNTAKTTLEWEEFARQRDAGEIVIEPRWFTPEEIEREKRRLSRRGRKGGKISGAIAVRSGQLAKASVKGALAANHVRWHLRRQIRNPECKLCQ